MAKDRYVGVVPPIVTPVDEFERVDEAALRGIVRRCKDVGLHGVFVAGSNGECMALTQAERNRAIRIVLDEAGPDYPVMSGVMDSSTQRVIDNIKALEDMGGDVAVVTPVFYARHATQDETVRHFEEILRHTKVKLMIYNIMELGLLKLFIRAIDVKFSFLFPAILMFCVMGVLALNNRMFDVWMMMLFGVVAYVLEQLGVDMTPIILGFILGPMIEKYFRSAMIASSGMFLDVFTRPISCVFMIVAVTFLLLPLFKMLRCRQKARKG